jgi:uncharacterized membrane protein YhaH (DUF805 family)
MGRFIKILFTPTTRIPAGLFIPLNVVVVAMFIGLGVLLRRAEEPNQFLLSGMLVLLWIQYCLMANRIQDCGHPGAMLMFPVFALTAWYILWLNDPSVDEFLMNSVDGELDAMTNFLLTARELALKAVPLVWAFCVIGEQSSEANGYGPAWGTEKKQPPRKSDQRQDPQDRTSRMVAKLAARPAVEAASSPAPEEPRRGRRQGFGQR